ncbi:MAG: bifunctional folylpolyglutamate synthase/dihydrofolate synthase [Solobacterium sp.]|nr:bifunctional folylpolyglutamate synthase/dihydrofolate synthase [Solobacterium sp.]
MDSEKKDQYWVMSRRNRSHGLEPIKEACRRAGNPQDKLKIIHVAGTNGKGSTVNYLRTILNEAGYKTGTFTSPHLTSHFDRIRIDDVWIEEDVFNQYLQKHLKTIEELDLGMFEIDCLIAFEWFYDRKVDYAVIETGLGGRLDNTNIVKNPVLELITTIGMDHMQILGDRITEIAFEKAGIIKKNSHCLYGYLQPACAKIIQHKAQRMHAAAHGIEKYREPSAKEMVFQGVTYEISGARYQKANAALAIAAAHFLGIKTDTPDMKEAVRVCQWKGRFETVSEHPRVILDGAHNEEGVRALCRSLDGLPKPLLIVFSALRDKPGRKMAEILKGHADQLIITHFENARADDTDGLAVEGAEIMDSWQEAVKKAAEECGEGTALITGSLYFVSVVRAWLTDDAKI